jgi:hypothetical protein
MVLGKLKGNKSFTRKYSPMKARSKKLRKKILGLNIFFVKSDSRGKLNKIIINNGIKVSR